MVGVPQWVQDPAERHVGVTMTRHHSDLRTMLSQVLSYPTIITNHIETKEIDGYGYGCMDMGTHSYIILEIRIASRCIQ